MNKDLYEGPVLAVFLQEHRALLARGIAIRLFGKIVAVVVCGWLLLGEHQQVTRVGVTSLGIIVCTLWLLEQVALDSRIARLQHILARGADPDGQDFYIRSRYQYLRIVRIFILWPRLEPLIWLLVIYGVSYLRAS